MSHQLSFFFFFFNDTATTEIYTLSLHDALPISRDSSSLINFTRTRVRSANSTSCASSTSRSTARSSAVRVGDELAARSEEHTSELQSRQYLVCRLLLEKKKNNFW